MCKRTSRRFGSQRHSSAAPNRNGACRKNAGNVPTGGFVTARSRRMNPRVESSASAAARHPSPTLERESRRSRSAIGHLDRLTRRRARVIPVGQRHQKKSTSSKTTAPSGSTSIGTIVPLLGASTGKAIRTRVKRKPLFAPWPAVTHLVTAELSERCLVTEQGTRIGRTSLTYQGSGSQDESLKRPDR